MFVFVFFICICFLFLVNLLRIFSLLISEQILLPCVLLLLLMLQLLYPLLQLLLLLLRCCPLLRGFRVKMAQVTPVVSLCLVPGVYLTNPQEIIPEPVIREQLCSDSLLLVRRQDVVSRWRESCNLGILTQQEDDRWAELNVLGEWVTWAVVGWREE